MLKRTKLSLGVFGLALFLAAPLQAAIMTLTFTGQVTEGNNLYSGISVGTPYTVTAVYDDTAAPAAIAPDMGMGYFQLSSLRLQIASFDVISTGSEVHLLERNGDRAAFTTGSRLFNYSVVLFDPTGEMFDITTINSLASLDATKTDRFHPTTAFFIEGYNGYIYGNLTNLTVSAVPEPTIATSLALLAGATLLRRRSR
ncbi:MAG TPA: PEP-CTERM sorting domain-containing protein [Tepidisphaeraceae bacterium]|jgi:hypothetical protein|nr:PEP-CTERM sorting domain-containing protein [Tepidisphaeraceae bacterium]